MKGCESHHHRHRAPEPFGHLIQKAIKKHWVLPKAHQVDFSDITDPGKKDLAEALVFVLSKLKRQLNDPEYNYVIHANTGGRKKNLALHWFLQIKPRMTTPAGFEMGSGMYGNSTFPQSDAKIL